MNTEQLEHRKTDEIPTKIASPQDGFLLTNLTENILGSLLETIPDVIYTYSTTRGRIFCSRSVENIFGYTAEYMFKNPMLWSEAIHPDDKTYVAAAMEAFKNAGVFDITYRIQHRDGGWRWLRDRFYDSIIECKETIVNGIASDITDQKIAENTNKANEKRYRELIESSHDWCWEVDVNGIYNYVSYQVRDILGYTPDEVLGKTPFHLMPEAEAARVKDIFEELCSRKTSFHRLEKTHLHKDGRAVVLETSGLPFFDDHGNLLGFRGMSRNITELKQQESERNGLEAQLMHAQKMESVGRLAGGVAHDFNNILMVIQSYSFIGQMESDPAQQISTYFEEINKASERASGLTRQLLAFARKQAISPKVIHLNDVVTDMINMMQRLIGEYIKLEWFPAAALWEIKMDPSQIDQILANLCVNAKDAIGSIGTIIIKTDNCIIDKKFCTEHPGAKQGEYILLSISDNGCGMDENTLSHVFEPFFTTKGIGKGTGLGLATTYGIVKQNNGFIDVSTKLNVGTSFRIYLPRYLEDDRQPQPEDHSMTNPPCLETILVK